MWLKRFASLGGVLCWGLCFAFSVTSFPSCDVVQRATMCFCCSLGSSRKATKLMSNGLSKQPLEKPARK